MFIVSSLTLSVRTVFVRIDHHVHLGMVGHHNQYDDLQDDDDHHHGHHDDDHQRHLGMVGLTNRAGSAVSSGTSTDGRPKKSRYTMGSSSSPSSSPPPPSSSSRWQWSSSPSPPSPMRQWRSVWLPPSAHYGLLGLLLSTVLDWGRGVPDAIEYLSPRQIYWYDSLTQSCKKRTSFRANLNPQEKHVSQQI